MAGFSPPRHTVHRHIRIPDLRRPGADKRIRIVSLTKKGLKLVEDAEPKWHRAQEALMEAIGADRWSAMRSLLRDTTRMVRHRTLDVAVGIA
jgi:hypothetical protein